MTSTSRDRASRSDPWLEIPLADYEAHMSLPSVGQAPLLAAQLQRLTRVYSPASLAVIGCAGGNGLDCIDEAVRVAAIDINPRYLQATAARHAAGTWPQRPPLVSMGAHGRRGLSCIN